MELCILSLDLGEYLAASPAVYFHHDSIADCEARFADGAEPTTEFPAFLFV